MNFSKEIDGVELELIENYFAKGDSGQLPEELVEYLALMESMAGRLRRWDTGTRKNHVQFFMAAPYNLSKYKAEQLYKDTIEFFYVETETSLEAYANYYAQRLESLANATIQAGTTEKAFETAGKLLTQAMSLRAKYRPKEADYPEELFEKKTIIYTDSKKMLGEESPGRQELAKLIDSWDIPEEARIRLRSEAGVDQPKLFFDENQSTPGTEWGSNKMGIGP